MVWALSHFPGQPRSCLSDTYWSLWLKIVPAVCFTASDNAARELLIMFKILIDSYTGFLKIKCATLPCRYSRPGRRHGIKQLRGCGVHFSCVKALTPACAEALSGQRVFQVTMNSSSVILQHFAIKLLLGTRALKQMKTKQKCRDIWYRNQWCFLARYLLTLPDSNLLPPAQKAHHST